MLFPSRLSYILRGLMEERNHCSSERSLEVQVRSSSALRGGIPSWRTHWRRLFQSVHRASKGEMISKWWERLKCWGFFPPGSLRSLGAIFPKQALEVLCCLKPFQRTNRRYSSSTGPPVLLYLFLGRKSQNKVV